MTDKVVTSESEAMTPNVVSVKSTTESVPETEHHGDELMSTATMQLIETVVQAGFLPPIVLCGVIFNVINMAVFLRQGLSDKVNLCLFCLSVCDTGYMLFLMLWRSYAIVFLVDDIWGEYWKARMINVVGVYHSFTDTSDCLTMLIAVDRSIGVLWPLKAKAILGLRKVRFLIVCAFLINFPTNLLFCAKFRPASYIDPDTNVTRYASSVTSFYLRNSKVVDNVFENVNIVVPVVSFSVVIIATILIAVRMRSVLAWRQDRTTVGGNAGATSSSKDRREAALTRMLAVICVIFTVCVLPFVISALCRLIFHEYRPEGRYSNLMFATTGITHLFISVNSSINFIVYYNMSSKFKATLKEMFDRKCLCVSSSDGIGKSRSVPAVSCSDNGTGTVVTSFSSVQLCEKEHSI